MPLAKSKPKACPHPDHLCGCGAWQQRLLRGQNEKNTSAAVWGGSCCGGVTCGKETPACPATHRRVALGRRLSPAGRGPFHTPLPAEARLLPQEIRNDPSRPEALPVPPFCTPERKLSGRPQSSFSPQGCSEAACQPSPGPSVGRTEGLLTYRHGGRSVRAGPS